MTLVALLILFSVLLPHCQLKEAASWLSVLFLVFDIANCVSLLAMGLKVSKENTGKQSNHSFVSKLFVSLALSNIVNNKIEL